MMPTEKLTRSGPARHLELLQSVGQFLALLAGSRDIQGFLDETVRRVAAHLEASVCSIYLFEDETDTLELTATLGLNLDAVGPVRLASGEGLVGLALTDGHPVCETHASHNPRFKAVPGLNEEPFDAFLAVPIQRGIEKVGVLVVQREPQRPFGIDDVTALLALASQLAGAIENARVLLRMGNGQAKPAPTAQPPERNEILRGKPASPGFAEGPSLRLGRRRELDLLRRAESCSPGNPATLADYERALGETSRQLEELQAQLDRRLPEVAALIFDAHLMMLKGRPFTQGVASLVREGASVHDAVIRTTHTLVDMFESSPHDYMREKARDVEDLVLRILSNLGCTSGRSGSSADGRVVVAEDLLPSDVLKLAADGVQGIALTGGGGLTAHVAILARSLKIPMVLVASPGLAALPDGTPVVLDGDTGNLFVAPPPGVRARLTEREALRSAAATAADRMLPETFTTDGTRIHLLANINLLSETELAVQLKAEGVGLYRTEFPFLVRRTLPTEDEQAHVYRALFSKMGDREVTVRTLDAGGDKMLAYFDTAGEANPELGLRSTRLTLRHPEMFDAQLCAILRASTERASPVRVMFPMITSLEEFRAARDRLLACRRALAGRQPGNPPPMPVIGMMLELPAVAELLDAFAREAEFFSIGTNDFIQYMLAADRTNPKVADYYQPHHPAVLRALHRVVTRLVHLGRDVSVCGEMAGDARFIPFLIALGIRKLSVEPGRLPDVQARIRAFSLPMAKAYAERLLACETSLETAAILRDGP